MNDQQVSVTSYWTQPTKEQNKIKKTLAKAELEAYAEEHELVLYRGKAIKPEDYPCKCELCDASKCWEDKHPNARDYQQGACKCRCHTYYEPF